MNQKYSPAQRASRLLQNVSRNWKISTHAYRTVNCRNLSISSKGVSINKNFLYATLRSPGAVVSNKRSNRLRITVCDSLVTDFARYQFWLIHFLTTLETPSWHVDKAESSIYIASVLLCQPNLNSAYSQHLIQKKTFRLTSSSTSRVIVNYSR